MGIHPRTVLVPIVVFVISLLCLPFVLSCSAFNWTCVILSCILAYLPSYLDRSEYEPGTLSSSSSSSRTWLSCQYWSGWHMLMEWILPNTCIIYENEDEMKKYKQVIYTTHPHGVMSFSHFLLMSNSYGFLSKCQQLGHSPHRDLAATVLFRLPLMRELVLWLGCIDASRPTAELALKRGFSLQLYPGGEHEQLLTSHTATHIYIRSRLGFIRLAIKYGIPIIPTFAFNEDRLYRTSSFLLPFRLWIAKKFHIALPLPSGRWGSLLPYCHPIRLVVGSPIPMPHIEHPTHEQFDAAMSIYIQALTDLFERHKYDPGCESYRNTILNIH